MMTLFSSRLQKLTERNSFPIFALIAINILVGLLVFRDYGLSIDEPFFYGYGDALGYAYTPSNWFREDFDLSNAYGPSRWDHGNRGPSYLLLARTPAHLLQALGLDQASAWHLANFLFFQVGLYVFYRMCLRWMRSAGALFASIFLSTQPILWEHAFINPKDMPFMVMFLISLELGFRMAERLAHPQPREKRSDTFKLILLPAIALGWTTANRILGPLAGVLVIAYFFLLGRNHKRAGWFVPYGLVAILAMIIAWPFLWENPVLRFIEVIRFMSYNPTQLNVFFYGNMYAANNLPLRYLPALMLFTLTEPVWPLAGAGFMVAAFLTFKKKIAWKSLLPTLAWFGIPFLYVLAFRPPMYDGFRHFLFIVPPLFILAGIALDVFFRRIQPWWPRTLLILLLTLPGLIAGIRLHPYQYTYYNQFVGGTGEAAYRFETDYWLTCYKDAVTDLVPFAGNHVNLFVKREPYIAAYYAPPQISVRDFSAESKQMQPGDYLLQHSRANPKLQRYRDPNQIVLRVERDGAIFCVTQKQ